jgi:CheY-like chemotaxis protein
VSIGSQTISICVVDDEATITRSLSLILSGEGYDVASFTNPLEALRHMRDNPPDLLITDIMMPQMSGVDLAICTARILPKCRILLFTASTEDLLHRARAVGHDFRLLQKPLHPEELLREIDRMNNDHR